MKISELIARLEKAKTEIGDLPVATWNGTIGEIRLDPIKEGCLLRGDMKPDEIALEIIAEDR